MAGDLPASALGDVNRDGRPDLVTANSGSDDVSVLLGDGAGDFGVARHFAAGDSPTRVEIGDVDGDRNPDLAVTHLSSSSVSVLLGDGAGGFGPPAGFPVDPNPVGLVVHDLDGDGNADLVVSSTDFAARSVSVLLSDGTGGFRAKTDYDVGYQNTALAVGDFNEDGHPDLAVGTDRYVAVLLGDGTGRFGPRTDVPAGLSPSGVVVDDFNGDGHADLATANLGDDDVSVLLGDGTGAFTAPRSYQVGPGPDAIAAGDLDGDGDFDLAVANAFSHTVSVRIGDGAGGFGVRTDVALPGTREGASDDTLAIRDLDGDGLGDLVTNKGASASSAAVFLRRPRPGDLVVDEFRTRGPGGARDDYVELVNAAPYMFNPSTARVEYLDASGGLQAVRLPSLVLAPGRHVLLAGERYGLSSYGSPDGTLGADLPDGGGVRVRGPDGTLDAAGCTSAAAGFREGAGLACPDAAAGGNYALVRRQTAEGPVDTDDNAADFALAADPAPVFGGLGSVFGAPGPQGTVDPRPRPYVHIRLLHPNAPADHYPNRKYKPASHTLKLRRTILNTSHFRVLTRLRLRIIGLSTAGAAGPDDALLRMRSALGETVARQAIAPTTLEEPPNQPDGGGLNTSVSVPLPGGGLGPGEKINVNLKFHVDRTGAERVDVLPEALARLAHPPGR